MANRANRFGPAATSYRSSGDALSEPFPLPFSKRPVSLIGLLRSIQILLDRAIDESGRAQMVSPSSAANEAGVLTAPERSVTKQAVTTVVDQLLSAKHADGASARYRETIRSHLRRFAACFQVSIDSITTSQIESWLRLQKVGPRTRNNMRGSIVTLFRFARKQGYLPKSDPTEADDLAKAKEYESKVGIITPEQLEGALGQAPEKIVLFVVLGAFTGMRSSEILRLEWHDFNFERRFITVAAEKAKTATRRLVPIQDNLLLWLQRYRGSSGRLFNSRRDAAKAIQFAKSCQIDWPNNALRHSYATYRLAAIADAARVALEMGNSPRKLMTNYRELVDEAQAKAWFNIAPK
jgi:integrase